MVTIEDLVQVPLFEGLSHEELQTVVQHSAEIHAEKGQFILYEGEEPFFFVLLSGRIELLKSLVNNQVINHYEPGEFFGDVPLLIGASALVSLRAAEPSRLMRLDGLTFRAIVVGHPVLSPRILTHMEHWTRRIRQTVLQAPTQCVTVVGRPLDNDCHVLRQFLSTNQVPYNWMEPEEAARRWNREFDCCPALVTAEGDVLVRPTRRQVAERLNLHTTPQNKSYDVAILGSGPAGLSAALYGASEGLRTLVIDAEGPGGQAGTSSHIANYLGFPTGVSGDELSRRALLQARNFGAEFVVSREVAGIEPGAAWAPHVVTLDDGDRIHCRCLVLATGVTWRRLELENVDRLEGRGIFYGASRTEAMTAQGKEVYLVGGGNSAGQSALHFSDYCTRVTLMVRDASLDLRMSDYLVREVEKRSNIRVMVRTEVVSVQGESSLESIRLRHAGSGQDETLPASMLFLLIGGKPCTKWLPEAILRDARGYVITGRDLISDASRAARWPLRGDPYLLETSVPGIFCAGDVRSNSIKRVASAVGEGSMAISFIHTYLDPHERERRPLKSLADRSSGLAGNDRE